MYIQRTHVATGPKQRNCGTGMPPICPRILEVHSPGTGKVGMDLTNPTLPVTMFLETSKDIVDRLSANISGIRERFQPGKRMSRGERVAEHVMFVSTSTSSVPSNTVCVLPIQYKIRGTACASSCIAFAVMRLDTQWRRT